MRLVRYVLASIGALVTLGLAVAHARNVDLSTVPKRDTVQLTIYNSEDLTLVRETRTVTFKKGNNPLQFSWANTLIDPTSVQLKFLTKADQLDVVDTTFPHDKPQMLYWNVQSEFDGEAKIEITYFTSVITWRADYLVLADKEETQLGFEGFVRVYNNSGEEYEDAQVRLVVGTINLVEKIAQLARVPIQAVNQNLPAFTGMRNQIVLESFDGDADGTVLVGGVKRGREKQIIKEGLSEYFIYTVDGTETIQNGWSKRMRSFEGNTVPFKIEYRYRPQEYGEQLVRMYILTNNEESKLGTTPLPDGIVRVFRHNGRDGLSYLTQQSIKYVPIGDKIELNLGPDPEVIFELIKLKVFRDSISVRLSGFELYRRVDDGAAQVDASATVAGWNEHEVYAQRVRNYTGKSIDVEVRRTFTGHVEVRSQLKPKLHDFQTVQFSAQVPAGTKKDLLFETVRRQGRNSRQSNVTLSDAEVAP